jgi:acid phosphatase type 7
MSRPAAILTALAVLSCFAPPAAADVPPAPRDPYAEATRPDQATLTWRSGSDPAPPGERYSVWRDGVSVGETDTPRFVDEWLLENTRYEYTVRAIGPAGESADSPVARLVTPPSRAFEIGPYLQQLTPTGVAIVWQTYDAATTALRFGAAAGPLPVLERNAELVRRHVVPVAGLQPGTEYRYQWESDGKLGAVASFRTPPAGPDSFSFAVIGDFGIGTPAARANLRRLSADPAVDLAITTGDNAQIYGTEDEYRRFVLGPLRDLIATKPFWPSVGNHDYYNLQNYLRFFAMPNGGLHYSFTYGGVLFVALDSNRFDRRQRAWLRATLRASPARCKVAYFHHPLWSSGRGYRGHARHLRRARFVPILQRGGVDLVLNGHMQNYERSKPLRAGRRSRRGIVYVVTGGGGARLNGFVTKRRPKWSARRGIFYHRLRIRVENHTFRGKAIDAGGDTRDRFRVSCRPG